MNPILLELIRGAVKTVASDVLTQPIASRPTDASVATKVVNELKNDPVFINETNSEPLPRSRVFWGTVGAVLSSLLVVVAHLASHGYDVGAAIQNWQTLAAAGAGISTALYALYGRVAPGLKPLGQGSVPSNADPAPPPGVMR